MEGPAAAVQRVGCTRCLMKQRIVEVPQCRSIAAPEALVAERFGSGSGSFCSPLDLYALEC